MASLSPGNDIILDDCCSNRIPALILNPELDLVFHAHFVSASEDTVAFHLMNDVARWLKASRLFISFSYNGSCCAFFAVILECQDKSSLSSPGLKLRLSSKIIGIESRMAYRVPIEDKFLLSARLFAKEGQVYLPRPIDLSFTGILIEFDETEDPDFSISDEFRLELRLDVHVIQLKAVVRRRDGHRYGLFFSEIVTKYGVNAPQGLRQIVGLLEHALPKGEGHKNSNFMDINFDRLNPDQTESKLY